MKKFLVILILSFLSISQISFAGSLDYKGLEKISKNNTFMDGEGTPYSGDKITDKEAEEAFVKIFKWIGEDPGREGLIETPKRVIKAFKEYFKGYNEDPVRVLDKTCKNQLI